MDCVHDPTLIYIDILEEYAWDCQYSTDFKIISHKNSQVILLSIMFMLKDNFFCVVTSQFLYNKWYIIYIIIIISQKTVKLYYYQLDNFFA